MRINELQLSDIHVGMKVKSLTSDKVGAIVKIDDDGAEMYSWIKWEGDELVSGGFYWNHCRCEVVDRS